MRVRDLKSFYSTKKEEIEKKIDEFSRDKTDREIFAELAFCILTPQSKAIACWGAISNLIKNNRLWIGNIDQIAKELSLVRFRNKKAEYIYLARRFFSDNGKISIKSRLRNFLDVFEIREWLVKNIKGIGYKEASHFLRNIGLGLNLVILDRHVLKNLKLFNVIDYVPNFLTGKKYLEIEKKMINFADRINVPVSHLDLVLWCKETGEIFK